MIERDVSESHLDAIEAQLALAQAQLASFRHHLERLKAQANEAANGVQVMLPERCALYEPQRCMLQDAEAKRAGGFGSTAAMCPGCGHEAS